jgi:hypothetical protein
MRTAFSRVKAPIVAQLVALPLVASLAFGCWKSGPEREMGTNAVTAFARTAECVEQRPNDASRVRQNRELGVTLSNNGLIINGVSAEERGYREGNGVLIRDTGNYGMLAPLTIVITNNTRSKNYNVTYSMFGETRTTTVPGCDGIIYL